MFQSIRADLRLYWRLLVMQVRAQAQYRFNLALNMITILLIHSLEFAAILLYFVRFPTLMGWHVNEMMLLVAFVTLSVGLAHMFGAGVDNFDAVIRLGEFDRVMLRPAGTFIQIMGNEFRLRDLGRLVEGLVLLAVAIALLPHVQWNPWKLLIIPIGILSNAAIFMGILLMGATICFWTIETTELVNIPFDGGREITSYPLTIYNPKLQQILLFVVPVAFGSYLPTCYILGRSLPLGLPEWSVFLSPMAAVLFLCAAFGIWNYGVHHYQSTGS